MIVTMSNYWRRLSEERFSLRFVLSRLFLRLHISLPIWLYFHRDKNIRTYLSATSAAHKLFLGKYKSALDIAVFERYVRAQMTVIDVGANIGMYSIVLGALVGEQGRVFSFEPTQDSYRAFLDNMSLNTTRNVTPFLLGVDERIGSAKFLDHRYSKEQNRLARKEEVGIPIQTIRLDSFLKCLSVDIVDFLKIDVEGSELSVLKSLGDTIPFVRVIYFEFNEKNYASFDSSKEEILAFFERNNFDIYLPTLKDKNVVLSHLNASTIARDTNCNILAINRALFPELKA